VRHCPQAFALRPSGGILPFDQEVEAVSALAVWRFAALQDAEQTLPRLESLARSGEIRIEDAALVTWRQGHRKPATRVLGSLTGPGALWGGFWGMLLGLVFLAPLAGPTFGAAAGAVAGSLSDFGVEDDFVKRVRDAVTPGSSALFLLSDSRSIDRIAVALEPMPVEMIRSDLSDVQEKRLREELGDETVRGRG
jgi:uncharacterized membrane protein